MKESILIALVLALVAGCSSSSKVRFNRNGPATVQTNSRSEPIYYNGKTYQLDYDFDETQKLFAMRISGLGAKQQRDAVNIATSSLGYFACPEGQRGKIMDAPSYEDGNWTLFAKCG
jgi:hypothetical protein